MKKRISVLIAVIMIAAMTAGCSSGGKNGSDNSAANVSNVGETANQEEASADSEKASGESNTEQGTGGESVSRVRPESSTLVVTESADEAQDSPDGDTEDGTENVSVPDDDEHVIDPEKGDDVFKADNPFSDINYTSYRLDGANVGSDVRLPAYYLLASKKELDDFIDKYKKTFSLNKGVVNGDSGNTDFISRVQQFDDSFFKTQDAIIIVAACENADDADLGSISYGDNRDVSIELWGSPSSGSKAQYVAYSVAFIKDALKDRNISIKFTGNVLEEEAE